MKLDVHAEELNTCVACGLCLPHCPTYRATGEEALSPRGRIEAMRAVHDRDAEIDADFVRFMATCVQCRGCEPACPSGVPFGNLIEGTRRTLADHDLITPWWQRLGFAVLPRHRLLLAASTGLAIGQRLRLIPKRLSPGRVPLRRGAAIAGTGDDVWLYTGCVMDAWFRDTHRSTLKILTALGVGAAVPGSGATCCGALHLHAGLHNEGTRLAVDSMRSMPGDAPILVNSAGCGAALKNYATELETDEARAFSGRVFDVHEWLAPRLDALSFAPSSTPIIVQDPCHLRHVQRAHRPVHALIGRVAPVVDLDDDGLCCGAGGAFSALEPDLAARIRDRKLASIDRALDRSGATVIVSANPGCSMHLQTALAERGVTVRHPLNVLADALTANR